MSQTCIWYQLNLIDIDIVEYEVGNSTQEIDVPRVNMGSQGDRTHRGQEET